MVKFRNPPKSGPSAIFVFFFEIQSHDGTPIIIFKIWLQKCRVKAKNRNFKNVEIRSTSCGLLTCIFFADREHSFCNSFCDKDHCPHGHSKFIFSYIQFNLRHGIEHNHQFDSTNAQNLKSKIVFLLKTVAHVSQLGWFTTFFANEFLTEPQDPSWPIKSRVPINLYQSSRC